MHIKYWSFSHTNKAYIQCMAITSHTKLKYSYNTIYCSNQDTKKKKIKMGNSINDPTFDGTSSKSTFCDEVTKSLIQVLKDRKILILNFKPKETQVECSKNPKMSKMVIIVSCCIKLFHKQAPQQRKQLSLHLGQPLQS